MKRYTVEFEPYSRKTPGVSISAKGMSVTLDAISAEAAKLEAISSMREAGFPDAEVKSVKEASRG